MKAIIPVKKSSIRIPNKNFKEFYNGNSLFDLTVDKLLKSLNPNDIYMSCEDENEKSLADKWGINFILREERLTDNDTPLYDVINGICNQVSGNDDIAWCQVIDPMFDNYEECFDIWNNGNEVLECGAFCKKNIKKNHDSLVVVYPHRDYVLNEHYEPEGFGFGFWHKKSQSLPIKYQMTFTLSILTRESIKKCGYHIGSNPFWFHAHNPRVDIDTLKDFELAKSVYHFFKNSTNDK
jgi:CMP-N-acetylneuraminic acid synthetase